MRIAGLTEIASFIAQCSTDTDPTRAWLMEMRHGTWTDVAALESDFANVKASHLPTVVFHIERSTVQIETLIDFQKGIVLITAIRRSAKEANDQPKSGLLL